MDDVLAASQVSMEEGAPPVPVDVADTPTYFGIAEASGSDADAEEAQEQVGDELSQARSRVIQLSDQLEQLMEQGCSATLHLALSAQLRQDLGRFPDAKCDRTDAVFRCIEARVGSV